MTHCTSVIVACRSAWSAGSATLTAVASINVILDARTVAARIHRRECTVIAGTVNYGTWLRPQRDKHRNSRLDQEHAWISKCATGSTSSPAAVAALGSRQPKHSWQKARGLSSAPLTRIQRPRGRHG